MCIILKILSQSIAGARPLILKIIVGFAQDVHVYEIALLLRELKTIQFFKVFHPFACVVLHYTLSATVG